MATISPVPEVERRLDGEDKDKINESHQKNRIEHAEIIGEGILPIVAKDKVDEFGGHAKVDPKEIALVKKLDLYMLVRQHAKSSL